MCAANKALPAVHTCTTHLETEGLPSARRLFRQPLVPLVGAQDGRWLLPAPLAPMLKPGGHGAIWKLMHDQGVFAWLAGCGREAALVRQIRRAHFLSAALGAHKSI